MSMDADQAVLMLIKPCQYSTAHVIDRSIEHINDAFRLDQAKEYYITFNAHVGLHGAV